MGGCLDKKKDNVLTKEAPVKPINSGIVVPMVAKLKTGEITEDILNKAKIEGLSNTIHLVKRGELKGCNIDIYNCENCLIIFDDWSSQTIIDECTNCFIVACVNMGSFFARKCNQCYFITSCYQFRISFSTKCSVSTCSLSSPTMEGCEDIVFSTFVYWNSENIYSLMEACCLNPFNNKFNKVYDFNTQYQGKAENNYEIAAKQPFFTLLDEAKQMYGLPDYKSLEYISDCELPTPYKYHLNNKNPDCFILFIAAADSVSEGLDILNKDDNVVCLESIWIKIKIADIQIIFKQVEKVGKAMQDNMAQHGLLAIKFAIKQYFMLDDFIKMIHLKLEKNVNACVFLKDDDNYAYVDTSVFSEMVELGVDV